MKVAVLLDNILTYDRRALLEIESLATLPIELTLFCNIEEGAPESEMLNGIKIFRLFPPEIYDVKRSGLKKRLAEKIGAHHFDVFHCHDHSMLWIGRLLKQKNPKAILIYESRELFHLYPLNYSSPSLSIKIKSWLVRKYEVMMERKNAAAMDYLVTVNDSLAAILKKYFRLKTEPVVTRNIGRLENFSGRNNILRKKFSIGDNDKILVYIGAHIYRHVLQMENALQQFGNQPGMSLIIITGADSHSHWFKNFVTEKNYRNIFFHPMIPIGNITAYLSGCDVGILSAWNKKYLSYWLALDNKLFSYIQAEIPILASAQPEYEKIVDGYKVGVCINPDELNAFINGFKKLEQNYETFIPNLKKAKEELCWEKEEQKLLGLYNSIIQKIES